MKVLVLGASGMLGSAMLRSMAESDHLDVVGTIRSERRRALFPLPVETRLLLLGDAQDDDAVVRVLEQVRPDAVINCVSPSRDAVRNQDPLKLIPICALLPHKLAALCGQNGARLVHISTDGVFAGSKGGYTEADPPDATDVYGVSKRLGELAAPHTVTLRTSMIGHELGSSDGLLEWFLSQGTRCNCFRHAVFSGLPTVVLAQVIRDVVLRHANLSGVYHVAARPISKCDLLRLIAEVYGKSIEIVADDTIAINRSLNPERFRKATGYIAPDWPTMIQMMHSSR